MTAQEFREMALSFPEVEEKAHRDHPDFRVCGRIFATLSYPDEAWGMVKLPPEQQEAFVAAEPKGFAPVKGAWGRQGCTSVRLKDVKKSTLRRAMAVAWEDAGRKKPRRS